MPAFRSRPSHRRSMRPALAAAILSVPLALAAGAQGQELELRAVERPAANGMALHELTLPVRCISAALGEEDVWAAVAEELWTDTDSFDSGGAIVKTYPGDLETIWVQGVSPGGGRAALIVAVGSSICILVSGYFVRDLR